MGQLMDTAPSLTGTGTPEEAWQACEQLRQLPSWIPKPPPSHRAVVVAPHPDDEILGVGGTLARLAAAGTEIVLVAVTDGEASHPGREDELRACRPQESAASARRLGVALAGTHRLGHADGAIDEDRLSAELGDLVETGDLLLAPWWRDGHPDHDAVGRISLAVARRHEAQTMAYLVWAWHWMSPQDGLPWSRGYRVGLGAELTRRKREAARCFVTQLTGPDPILPPHVLRRLTRPYEILVTT